VNQVRLEDNRMVLSRQVKQTLANLSRWRHTPLDKFTPVVTQQLGETALDPVIGAVLGVAIECISQFPPSFSFMVRKNCDQRFSHLRKTRGINGNVARIEIWTLIRVISQIRGEHYRVIKC
jgi:hypothetical protein